MWGKPVLCYVAHSACAGRRDVAAGEQATRVPQLGISNYSEPLVLVHPACLWQDIIIMSPFTATKPTCVASRLNSLCPHVVCCGNVQRSQHS